MPTEVLAFILRFHLNGAGCFTEGKCAVVDRDDMKNGEFVTRGCGGDRGDAVPLRGYNRSLTAFDRGTVGEDFSLAGDLNLWGLFALSLDCPRCALRDFGVRAGFSSFPWTVTPLMIPLAAALAKMSLAASLGSSAWGLKKIVKQ